MGETHKKQLHAQVPSNHAKWDMASFQQNAVRLLLYLETIAVQLQHHHAMLEDVALTAIQSSALVDHIAVI